MNSVLDRESKQRSRRARPGEETVFPARPALAYQPPPRRHPPLIDYTLAIPSNGRETLRLTLESFRQHVSPSPTRVVVFADGFPLEPWGGGTPWNAIPWEQVDSTALGFCGATRALWSIVSRQASDFVFWLEDDFLFLRDLELRPLAEVLFEEPRLTQMGLMRGPANQTEIDAGGVIAAMPEAYAQQDGGWIESLRNHSTGCSLMRRAFMEANPWPDYPDSCEGRFSLDLLHAGFTFGVWGRGEPWVEHIGRREGWGY